MQHLAVVACCLSFHPEDPSVMSSSPWLFIHMMMRAANFVRYDELLHRLATFIILLSFSTTKRLRVGYYM